MATDNSPPRIRAIFITAVIAFSILVGLKFVFDSYYLKMFEAEEYAKIGSVQSEQLIQLRQNEKRNLTSAPVPIDRAMVLLTKSRDEASQGMPDGGIIPEPSNDPGALIGWAKLPHTLTAAELGADDAGAAGMATTDGGALDGAAPAPGTLATNNAAGDGGAASPATNALSDAGVTPKHDAGSSPHP